MSLTNRFMETMENLFASGADDDHSEEEMLSLLEPLNYCALIQAVIHEASPVYLYLAASKTDWPAGGSPDSRLCYRGLRLSAYNAFRLYVDQLPGVEIQNQTCQRSLELWLLSDMSLVVTSCFRMSDGALISEYRQIKSTDWRDTEMQIDFRELADMLTQLCKLAKNQNGPFYEL